MEKSSIRQQIKLLKGTLSPQYKQQSSEAVKAAIEHLPQYEAARSILLYNSLPDELSTHIMLEAWYPLKKIYLPVVEGDEIAIGEYHPGHMHGGAFGIIEPDIIVAQPVKIDIAIIPGVAFDTDKTRIGRGRGYYDKLLSRITAYKIGICYQIQLLNNLPCQPHDVKMDCIITEKETII